jgi:long-chain acyl-CoA synthetase
MLNKILSHTHTTKMALVADDRQITYAELNTIIGNRAANIPTHANGFLLNHADDLENLLTFLAILATGQKAVFGGKDTTPEQLLHYAQVHGLAILDKIEERPGNNFYSDLFSSKYSDIFLGVLTSGSTGTSKIIWKDYQAWESAFLHQSKVFDIQATDTVFVVNALAYSANLNMALHCLWMGGTLVLGKIREANSWSRQFRQLGVSAAFLVPSHLRLFLNYASGDIELKSMVTAGEKLDVKTAKTFLSKCPQAQLTEYYGAAELGHISFQQNQDIIDYPASVGKAFPEVEISLKDGQVWVQSPYISPGYRHSPTVGDLGIFDDQQRLVLLGRGGRMFNRRGLNIYAQEIESATLLHPKVAEAVAINSSECTSKSFISLHVSFLPGQTLPSRNEFYNFLLQKLAKSKLPNAVVFYEALPRNFAGKLDLSALMKKPVVEEDAFFDGLVE